MKKTNKLKGFYIMFIMLLFGMSMGAYIMGDTNDMIIGSFLTLFNLNIYTSFFKED